MSVGIPLGVIALDRRPVTILGDALHRMWWRGSQWAVTEYGIECLDGTYPIEAKRLLRDMETLPLPNDMAEKDWVDADEFATAWMVALVLHGKAAGLDAKGLLPVFACMERDTHGPSDA